MSDYELISEFLTHHKRGCPENKGQPCTCNLHKAREAWATILDRSMELTQVDYDPLAALDQMEQERQALQQMYDLDKAYDIYYQRFIPLVNAAFGLAVQVREQGGMFLPPKLVKAGEEFGKLWDELEKARKGVMELKNPDQAYQAGFEEEPHYEP